MTTIHASLPLTEHKRKIVRAWLEGKRVQFQDRGKWHDYHPCRGDMCGNTPGFSSPHDDDYRIAPQQTQQTRRWYTRKEAMEFIGAHGSRFLIKFDEGCEEEEVYTASLIISTGIYITTGRGVSVTAKNFMDVKASFDGGKTWTMLGVEVNDGQ